MSNNVIIFGSKKFGVSNTPVSTEKYPNTPVLLIEASKQGGKSRRIIFNKKASEILGLEMGFVQQIVFGFVQGDTVGLIANATDLPSETLNELQTYRTSKNKVTSENPLNRGKGISSTTLTKEISEYFDLDSSVENEFSLNTFESEGIESFSMELITGELTESTDEVENIQEEVIDQELLDTIHEEETVSENTVEFNDSDFSLR